MRKQIKSTIPLQCGLLAYFDRNVEVGGFMQVVKITVISGDEAIVVDAAGKHIAAKVHELHSMPEHFIYK